MAASSNARKNGDSTAVKNHNDLELPDPAQDTDDSACTGFLEWAASRGYLAETRNFSIETATLSGMRSMLRFSEVVNVRLKDRGANRETVEEGSLGWCPYYEIGLSAIATVSVYHHGCITDLFGYTLTSKKPLDNDSFSRKFAAYLTSKNPATSPIFPPDAAARGGMLQLAQALLVQLPMSETLPICNYGLWSRIFWQYQNIALGTFFPHEIETTGAPAPAEFGGNISAAAYKYLEHSARVAEGSVIFVELPMADLEVMMGAIRILLATSPVIRSCLLVDGQDSSRITMPDPSRDEPSLYRAGEHGYERVDPAFVPISQSHRFSQDVLIVCHATDGWPTAMLRNPGDTALGLAGLPTALRPMAPGTVVDLDTFRNVFSPAVFARALGVLSQAIPDAGGAMAGLEMAMTLATGEKIVADARNATADDPIYLGPFLRGSVAVGQGPTLVSCFQYLQDVDAQRRATNEVVRTAVKVYEPEANRGRQLAPVTHFGRMLRVSVVQALRYIGVRPAAMGDRPPTVDVGNDESAIYRTLIDSKTGVESGLATLIARACARLFGLRLHACYLESLRPQQHATRQGREPRTDYGEWAPRNWPKWRALQGPGPICFPKSLTTGVSEPGFFYDEEAMFQRAVDSLTFVSGSRVEFAGQDKSQRIGDSVSLRPNVGLGAGVDVLFRLTAVDIDRDHEFALQGHTRQVRRASSDDSLHIGLGEVVEMDDPFFNIYEYDEPLQLPTNIKASFYSRVPNTEVWETAGKPRLPSDFLLKAEV